MIKVNGLGIKTEVSDEQWKDGVKVDGIYVITHDGKKLLIISDSEITVKVLSDDSAQ